MRRRTSRPFCESACGVASTHCHQKLESTTILATARVDSDALPVLVSLRAHGFRTAIVSNTPWGSPSRAWREELGRHGLLAVVDAVVFCVDVGYRKPHPAPMERALQLLGVRPSEAMFVGDDAHWDVLGAQQMGIQPILLTRQPGTSGPPDVPVAASLREVLDKARNWSAPQDSP